MTVTATFFALLQALLLLYFLWITTFYGLQLVGKVYERIVNRSRLSVSLSLSSERPRPSFIPLQFGSVQIFLAQGRQEGRLSYG